jgi:cyanophycinase
MSLVALVGSGEYMPGMETVDRELLSRLPSEPRVVCLPTAAGQEGAERIAYWSRLGVEHFTRLGAQVDSLPVIDPASAADPRLAERIAAANFVYLSGGRPGYLYRILAGSLAWRAILSVLESGGILAGCSAGAMVLGERFFGFPALTRGFALLPGALIVPHFDEFPQPFVAATRWLTSSRLTFYGIEADTALVVSSSGMEVLGRRAVTVWTRRSKTRYTQGQIEL